MKTIDIDYAPSGLAVFMLRNRYHGKRYLKKAFYYLWENVRRLLNLIQGSERFEPGEILQKVDFTTLEAIRRGDHHAFRTIYFSYVETIRDFLTRLVKNSEMAQELTQNVFVTLWEKREHIDPYNNIKGYLYRIARNSVFKYFDHQKVKEKYNMHAVHGHSERPSSDDQLIAEEVRMLVDIAIDRMPEQRKKIFSLYYHQDQSPSEIAQRLNLARSTVETHLAHARKDIRQLLRS